MNLIFLKSEIFQRLKILSDKLVEINTNDIQVAHTSSIARLLNFLNLKYKSWKFNHFSSIALRIPRRVYQEYTPSWLITKTQKFPTKEFFANFGKILSKIYSFEKSLCERLTEENSRSSAKTFLGQKFSHQSERFVINRQAPVLFIRRSAIHKQEKNRIGFKLLQILRRLATFCTQIDRQV